MLDIGGQRTVETQTTLRRLRTLVIGTAAPEEVFGTVASEAARLLGADYAWVSQYHADGTATVLGAWAREGGFRRYAPGARVDRDSRTAHSLVFRTGRPARLRDSHEGDDWKVRDVVGVPIHLEGRQWGVIVVACKGDDPLPADTEEWLTGFNDLVASAVATAHARVELSKALDALSASRARIFAAADNARRRIERDLHDGAQQRLVSLALQLRAARAEVPPEAGALGEMLDRLADGLAGAVDELREIAGGIHPARLASGGLAPALRALARRSAVPVELDIRVDGRLPEPVELAAYYAVAEALTNTAKHASATVVYVDVAVDAGALLVRVRDDGSGGAEVGRGSGLVGLIDRVETQGGHISLRSPAGAGTTVEISLPLRLP